MQTLESSTILHILSVVLFAIGILTVLVRKNTIVLLMGIELILNAVNLSFVTYSRELSHLSPQLMVFFIITIAAAESAIGLSIIVNLFRSFGSVDTDEANVLRG